MNHNREPNNLEKRLRNIGKIGTKVIIGAHAIDIVQSLFTGKTFMQYVRPNISNMQVYVQDIMVILSSSYTLKWLNNIDKLERYGTTDQRTIVGMKLQDAYKKHFGKKADVVQLGDYRKAD